MEVAQASPKIVGGKENPARTAEMACSARARKARFRAGAAARLGRDRPVGAVPRFDILRIYRDVYRAVLGRWISKSS